MEGPGAPSTGPGVLRPHPSAGLWTCPSQPVSPPAQGPGAPGSLPEALPSSQSPVCGSWWQAFGSPSRKLCSSLQHQLCLSPPDHHGCPPAGKRGYPRSQDRRRHGTWGCAGLPHLRAPTPVRLEPSISPPPSLACSSPWGSHSHVRSCVPTGALASTLLNTGRREGSPYMNLNLQVTSLP